MDKLGDEKRDHLDALEAEHQASVRNRKVNPTTRKQNIPKIEHPPDEETEYSRWRLRDDRGRQTWHYLQSDEAAKQWPQSIPDKYFLGLETDSPKLSKPQGPQDAAENGMTFFSRLQLPPGNWGCEFGGPMFLLPGLIIALYVTGMPLTKAEQTEVRRYIFSKQKLDGKNGSDGGWGIHVEGDSSVFGTAMNYTTLRLLSVSADDPRMFRARGCLHDLGGAVCGPHWAKFWLSVLGVMKWDIVNPVPPESWLLPDWVPISPWRWFIHMRQSFLPMSFIWSKRWVYPAAEQDPLIQALRDELFVDPYNEVLWAENRNSIADTDNYHPKSRWMNWINWLLVFIWIPFLRTAWIVRKAEAWTYRLIQMEDENTDYANLGAVSAPMNLLCCYIQEGVDAESVKRHRDRMQDFLWLSKDGMMMNGTNGVQTWDTAFAIQAAVEAGLAQKPQYKEVMMWALEFLHEQQIIEHPVGYETSKAYSQPPTSTTAAKAGYRQYRKGAWAFSTREQGYAVSDCTGEALKAILLLQHMPDPEDPEKKFYPQLVSEERMRWAVDVILTMSNESGGCGSYEPTRGSESLELLNAAEVFGRIMVEYDYPECTTACITSLVLYSQYYPDYRINDIKHFNTRAVGYIRRAQRKDGSWYGSWGICFTYAGMLTLEALATKNETWANSKKVFTACKFFLDRQNEDGGWGESFRSCETGEWCEHPEGSQVVQTAWVIIALLHAQYPGRAPIEKAINLLMRRQQPNGEWLQEGVEGVFNKSCMIFYPNYKFIFPIKALGMYAKRLGSFTEDEAARPASKERKDVLVGRPGDNFRYTQQAVPAR